MQFKVGDRVTSNFPNWTRGLTGTVVSRLTSGMLLLVDFGRHNPAGHDGYYFLPSSLTAAPAPSVASDLRLTPQAKSVLLHLRKHGRITPMKADVNYGITRLASCIHEIRKVGYDVETVVERDEGGHKFANYKLATVD